MTIIKTFKKMKHQKNEFPKLKLELALVNVLTKISIAD